MIDAIYLDKRGSDYDTSKWVYYRITSVNWSEFKAGQEKSSVEVCRVNFPKFEDTDSPTDSPGQTGMKSAYIDVLKILEQRWGVEHKDENLIGLRERE